MDVRKMESARALSDGAGDKTLEMGTDLTHIDPRPSKRISGSSEHDELLVTSEAPSTVLQDTMNSLEVQATNQQVLPRFNGSKNSVPWFPIKIEDLDEIANHNLNSEVDLESDHPQQN
eukprot:XP_011666984.1 PREDICTED: probable phenylalanine-4-hydroxylase 1 [Strongylocentrotus purpuratus]